MKELIKNVQRKTVSGISILRERGLTEFAREVVKKGYFSYKGYCYMCDLNGRERSRISVSRNIKVVDDLFDETISWIVSLGIPGTANAVELQNMRSESHLVYTLLVDDLIVGYAKIGRGRVYVVDFQQYILFPEKTAFVMDSFIHQKQRGKKLFNVLISDVKESLKKKGHKRLFCHIRADNRVSISAYEKNGFYRLGPASYRRSLWRHQLSLPADFC